MRDIESVSRETSERNDPISAQKICIYSLIQQRYYVLSTVLGAREEMVKGKKI